MRTKPVTESDGKHKTEPVQIKLETENLVENYAYLDSFDVVKGVQNK